MPIPNDCSLPRYTRVVDHQFRTGELSLYSAVAQMSDEMIIRCVREGDVESLAGSLRLDVSTAQVKRRFEESQLGYRTMLVAELNGCAVGTVSMGGGRFQRPGSLRMFALDVGIEFRGCGIGTALIRAVEAVAVDMGTSEVNLEVSVENEDAIRLYERLGFHRLPEQATDRWEQLRDDGSTMTVEEQSWIMVKRVR